MPLQVDQGGGEALRRIVEKLGVHWRTSIATAKVRAGRIGPVSRMDFSDGSDLPVDLVVFATGVRPRDELARASGLTVGERGGVMVDDSCRVTADTPDTAAAGDVFAIGEVACIGGRTWGLVAPGYTMAEIVADRLLGGAATFPGADVSTKLKLLGADVASFGDSFAQAAGALEVVYADPVAGVYKKLVMSDDAPTLLGGVLVGDAVSYASLRPMVGQRLGSDPTAWLLPQGAAAPSSTDLPDGANVCSGNNVDAASIRCAVTEQCCIDLAGVKSCTRAGTSCGSCLPLVKQLVSAELEKTGISVSNALCEHFELSRAQLFDVVRVRELGTFSEILERHGRGRGWDICRPGDRLDPRQPAAGARARPRQGAAAGHQRPRDGQPAEGRHLLPRTPHRRRRGHACRPDRDRRGWPATAGCTPRSPAASGSTCSARGSSSSRRYGSDSSMPVRVRARIRQVAAHGEVVRGLAVVPVRRRGLGGAGDRPGAALPGPAGPAQDQAGISGCTRECAEARSKDVGVIATDKGWNMYVGGNGGFTPPARGAVRRGPQHRGPGAHHRPLPDALRPHRRPAAADRSMGRGLRGGVEAILEVVIGDSPGIGADLDAAMGRHVDSYADEWAATLADPEKRAQFVSFVNPPEMPDPGVGGAIENKGTIIAGATLEARG
jgi:nitrite reductase (NADH) large subunit